MQFRIIVLDILARYPRANTALDECNVELSAAGSSGVPARLEAHDVAQLHEVLCFLHILCQVRCTTRCASLLQTGATSKFSPLSPDASTANI
jgi:hypothetical protein